MTSALLIPLFLVAGLAQTPDARSASPKPFSRLFQKPDQKPDPQMEAARRALEQKVAALANGPKKVCSMRVYRTDPAVDPGFVRKLPADTSGMAIRRIPLPCVD